MGTPLAIGFKLSKADDENLCEGLGLELIVTRLTSKALKRRLGESSNHRMEQGMERASQND